MIDSPRPVLRVEHLTKDFTIRGSRKVVHACDDITFDVMPGQTVGVIGESGSGKTTLGRCVLRLLDPTSGSIALDGEEITTIRRKKLRALRSRIQIVFQEPADSFNPVLTVGGQIEIPVRVFTSLSATARKARVAQLLKQVGLAESVGEMLPTALSAGVLQKCSIARALASEPRLLVLDEPTSSLAPEAEADVIDLLVNLQRDLGLAYLFISHDLSLVRRFCDVVAVMYLGQIVELGPRAEVYETQLHPYTKGLLASVLRPDPAQRIERANAPVELRGEVPSPIDLPPGCYLSSRCRHVEEACVTERQVLRTISPGRTVRCWKAEDLLSQREGGAYSA